MCQLPQPRIVNIPENVTHILFKFLASNVSWEDEREYFEDSDSALKAITAAFKNLDRFNRFELLNIKTRQLYIFEK